MSTLLEGGLFDDEHMRGDTNLGQFTAILEGTDANSSDGIVEGDRLHSDALEEVIGNGF